MFNALWKLGKHEQAVKVYVKAGRPFWFSETVGQYYERNGQVAKAMKEYDFLIDEYLKMKLLPLPGGPVELYKLGKWHIKKEPYKARKLLRMYLRAEKEDCGAGFGIRYKKQALRLLTN